MISKIPKDLKVKENIFGQIKSLIKKLDKKIIEMQNFSICYSDISHNIFFAAAKFIGAAV